MHPTADTPPVMYINGLGRRVMPGVRRPDMAESGGDRPEGLNTMLWILILPAVAAIAMITYVLGYSHGKRDGKKSGLEMARREYGDWREMRYCGTAQAHMAQLANEVRQHEGKPDDA